MADKLYSAFNRLDRAALQHLEIVLVLVAHEILHLKIMAAFLRDDLAKNLIARPAHVVDEVRLLKRQTEVMECIHLHTRMNGLAVDDDAIHVKDKCCRLQVHSPLLLSLHPLRYVIFIINTK